MHHVIFKKQATECLRKAHHLIDEQEIRDRNLILGVFRAKGGMEEGGRDAAA